jgi:hypothetical protein
VVPGETATLKISWKAKASRVFARAGYVRDFYFVGQWFPKIGVLEPKGRRRRAEEAWNCHQYHADSEFYADFGDYRVAITLPKRFIVGATGVAPRATTIGRRPARHSRTTSTTSPGPRRRASSDHAPLVAASAVSERDSRRRRSARAVRRLRLSDVDARLLIRRRTSRRPSAA